MKNILLLICHLSMPVRKRIGISSLLKNEAALAAVEFALTLPLLILLTFGTVEVTRYVLISQKLERVSTTLADLVTQNAAITAAQLDQIIPAAGQVLLPYSFSNEGYAVISSIKKVGNANPTVPGNIRSGNNVQSSRISTGGSVTCPRDIA